MPPLPITVTTFVILVDDCGLIPPLHEAISLQFSVEALIEASRRVVVITGAHDSYGLIRSIHRLPQSRIGVMVGKV